MCKSVWSDIQHRFRSKCKHIYMDSSNRLEYYCRCRNNLYYSYNRVSWTEWKHKCHCRKRMRNKFCKQSDGYRNSDSIGTNCRNNHPTYLCSCNWKCDIEWIAGWKLDN